MRFGRVEVLLRGRGWVARGLLPLIGAKAMARKHGVPLLDEQRQIETPLSADSMGGGAGRRPDGVVVRRQDREVAVPCGFRFGNRRVKNWFAALLAVRSSTRSSSRTWSPRGRARSAHPFAHSSRASGRRANSLQMARTTRRSHATSASPVGGRAPGTVDLHETRATRRSRHDLTRPRNAVSRRTGARSTQWRAPRCHSVRRSLERFQARMTAPPRKPITARPCCRQIVLTQRGQRPAPS